MPTYVYRRQDGSTFEIEQRITEPALTVDPETGGPVQRVISGAGLVFKGSGFYLTDYSRKGDAAGESKKEAKAESPATKDGTSGDTAGGPAPAPAAAATKPAEAPSTGAAAAD